MAYEYLYSFIPFFVVIICGILLYIWGSYRVRREKKLYKRRHVCCTQTIPAVPFRNQNGCAFSSSPPYPPYQHRSSHISVVITDPFANSSPAFRQQSAQPVAFVQDTSRTPSPPPYSSIVNPSSTTVS